MRAETPSEVLFDFLKCDLQINNREAARILISDKPMGSKPAPRFRIAEKTFLSRRVVHVVPGTDKIDPGCLPIFRKASRTWPPLQKSAAKAAWRRPTLASKP